MRVLLTGASSQIGSYLLRELSKCSDTVLAWTGSRTGSICGIPLYPVDLVDRDATVTAFHAAKPDLVIHAAAMTTIPQCFRDPTAAHLVNVDATALLTELADSSRSRLVLVSTDLVFDGKKGWYGEHDTASPETHYGRTKLAAEQPVLAFSLGTVIRLSLMYGPSIGGRLSFFDQQVSALREGRTLTLFEDEWRTPLALTIAAQSLLTLARSDFRGLLHFGGPERMSRMVMGQRLAEVLRCDPSPLLASRRADIASPEPRPRDTSLDSSRWCELFPNDKWLTFEQSISQMLTTNT